jgi:threonine dehydratase
VIVPSYEHADIIAGQGTVGLEIAEQSVELGLPADQVLICCGGGGLTAGSAVAIRGRLPDAKVFTVEPEDFDDTARSLASGRRERVATDQRSICDALLTESPGRMTLDIMQALVSRGLTVSDAEVGEAMRFAFRQLKLVVEPGGAVALAAVLAGRLETAGRTTVVVLSGGNVDFELFARIQGEPA